MKNGIVYCRESRDDGKERYERIETQRDILLDFCARKQIFPLHIVMDDNESGSSFDRMNKVRRWVETEEIACFVAKDSSRIGRNQLESLSFIRFLEHYQVELLFESEQYDETLFGLYAWLNERRAREDSLKIKRVLHHKMDLGELLIKPTYGYTIDHKMLKIHPHEAENVRFVFHQYLNGRGMSEIAQILQVRSPEQKWSCQKISRMLRNPIYCGTYQIGKTSVLHYGSKKSKRLPKEEWVTIENHHPQIISKSVYESALNRLNQRTRIRVQHRFSGLLFCGDCGAPMTRRAQNSEHVFYVCSSYNKCGTASCSAHKIEETAVDRMLCEALLLLFQKRNGNWQNADINSETAGHRKELESRINQLDLQLERLYEDRQMTGFPASLFEKKLQEYNRQRTALSEELKRLEPTHVLKIPKLHSLSKEQLGILATRIEVLKDGTLCVTKKEPQRTIL